MKFACSALVLALFLVSQGTAQSVKAQTNNGLPKPMPSDREIALTMSAGPANVADKATKSEELPVGCPKGAGNQVRSAARFRMTDDSLTKQPWLD